MLKSLTVISVAQCFAECEIHKDCKSVNHAKNDTLNCQLNSKVKQETSSADFSTASAGWTYYATNYNNTKNVSFFIPTSISDMGVRCVPGVCLEIRKSIDWNQSNSS